MVLLMLFAAIYCVLQLVVVATPARSLRFSTLLLVAAAGCFGSGALAAALQLLYTRGVASLTGQPLYGVVLVAGYAVDPVIEEVV